MKLFLIHRPSLSDYVMLFYASATEHLPERVVKSKMAFLPDDSPAVVGNPHTGTGWFYKGEDAETIFDQAAITMGEESRGPLENDYDAIREEHPDQLKPYGDLTDEEKGRHYRAYQTLQADMAAFGAALAK